MRRALRGFGGGFPVSRVTWAGRNEGPRARRGGAGPRDASATGADKGYAAMLTLTAPYAA